jgi:hypothetical protein
MRCHRPPSTQTPKIKVRNSTQYAYTHSALHYSISLLGGMEETPPEGGWWRPHVDLSYYLPLEISSMIDSVREDAFSFYSRTFASYWLNHGFGDMWFNPPSHTKKMKKRPPRPLYINRCTQKQLNRCLLSFGHVTTGQLLEVDDLYHYCLSRRPRQYKNKRCTQTDRYIVLGLEIHEFRQPGWFKRSAVRKKKQVDPQSLSINADVTNVAHRIGRLFHSGLKLNVCELWFRYPRLAHNYCIRSPLGRHLVWIYKSLADVKCKWIASSRWLFASWIISCTRLWVLYYSQSFGSLHIGSAWRRVTLRDALGQYTDCGCRRCTSLFALSIVYYRHQYGMYVCPTYVHYPDEEPDQVHIDRSNYEWRHKPKSLLARLARLSLCISSRKSQRYTLRHRKSATTTLQ